MGQLVAATFGCPAVLEPVPPGPKARVAGADVPAARSMSLAMLDGIRAGFSEEELVPRPVSIPGSCCVAFAPSDG